MIVVLLGPPGSGKGTQADFLKKKDGFEVFSTGDLIREEIERGTPMGREMKEYVDRGELVPDEYLFSLVSKFLQNSHNDRIIFDGFPRNLSQDEMFRKAIGDRDFITIFLNVSDETVLKRLLNRMRKDDSEEVIKRRLKVYKENTYPLIEKYRREGRLYDVDGEKSIEEVYTRIKEIIDAHI